MNQLITWNVYEVSSKSAQLNGVSLRGRIRKWGLERNINVITDNAEDADNVVRFATLRSDDGTAISEYIRSTAGDVQIELKLEAVANPVLSKLKVNIESRYQI